jgi:hypothetical protein
MEIDTTIPNNGLPTVTIYDPTLKGLNFRQPVPGKYR